MQPRSTLVPLILLGVSAVPVPAQLPAAAPATNAGSDLPFPVTTPPPAWIQPGLRLTFHSLQGTIGSGDHEYEADEKGEWVDAAGNRYAQKDVLGTGSEGFLQVNVIGLTRQTSAAQFLFFLLDGPQGSVPLQTVELASVADAGCGGDLWLHPDALKRLLQEGAAGLQVRRIEYRLGQASYQAVFLYWRRPAGRALWIYDLDSGVLLYGSDVTRLAGRRAQSGEVLSQGGSVARFTTFKASRQLDIPWAKAAPPAFVAEATAFDYRGTMRVLPGGVIDTPLPFTVQAQVQQRGVDWVQYQAVAGGPVPLNGGRVTGNCQFGGLWLPPAACGALRTGQVLDRDPITQVAIRVTYTDDQVVQLTQESPRQTQVFTYRRSDGLLAKGTFTDRLQPVPGTEPMARVLEIEHSNTR